LDFAWLIDRRAVDLIKMLVRVAGPPEVPVPKRSITNVCCGQTRKRNPG
jgi:hypothetical protein